MFVLKDYILLAALAAALYTDIRRGKIYNWLTFGLAGFALLYHLGTGGPGGLLFSLRGMLAGTLIFLLPFLLGGLGGGDIKLVGAIGALQGPDFILKAAIAAALAGGVLAVAVMLRRGIFVGTLRRLWTELRIMLFRLQSGNLTYEPQSAIGADKYTFPYGIPIVCGTLAAYFL